MARKSKRWRRQLLRTAAGGFALLCASLVIFRFVPVPLTSLVIIRAVEGHGYDRDWEPLEALGPLAAAVVGREDQRFCDHSGVDWVELKKVALGQRSGGASTITMQTAKNVYLWPSQGGHPVDYLRKLLEVPLAVVLEAGWGKRRILEVYLNVIEYGPGIYGGEAAAQHYYGVAAADLSDAQATALAALLPSPLTRSPSARTGAEIAATRLAGSTMLTCLTDTAK